MNGDLRSMQLAVQRDWTAASHWHIGDLAWQSPSLADRRLALWLSDGMGALAAARPSLHGARGTDHGHTGDGVVGWARMSADGDLEMQATDPGLVRAILAWAGSPASVTVMETDTAQIGVLTAEGYRAVDGPFFRHCLRDLSSLPAPRLPEGYRVRAVRPDEVEQRAAVHRAAWRPRRVGELQVPPVDLGDGESPMTADRYRSIMDTWPYRHDLDQVVEAPDGTFAASALGWYDDVNRVGLLEPVGTDPRHDRLGLGAAVSIACLHAMRSAGATRAVVCPRGDDAYPVPRHLYHRIGFRDEGRTVTYAR
jgi:hypothetical protein